MVKKLINIQIRICMILTDKIDSKNKKNNFINLSIKLIYFILINKRLKIISTDYHLKCPVIYWKQNLPVWNTKYCFPYSLKTCTFNSLKCGFQNLQISSYDKVAVFGVKKIPIEKSLLRYTTNFVKLRLFIWFPTTKYTGTDWRLSRKPHVWGVRALKWFL